MLLSQMPEAIDATCKQLKVMMADAYRQGQQFERKRIKEIVGKLSTPKDPWIHYETLLEKIDASEDS